MTSAGAGLLRATFVDEAVAATAELLIDAAPRTVAGVLSALPIEGDALHGIYSGSEAFTLLAPDLWLPAENATDDVSPGDVAYGRVRGGEHYGFPHDLSELCWFYDHDAIPSMPGGSLPVNVFARFVEGWDAFAAVCRAMRREGTKRIRFEVVG